MKPILALGFAELIKTTKESAGMYIYALVLYLDFISLHVAVVRLCCSVISGIFGLVVATTGTGWHHMKAQS
jgi:hypothetical protein